jgi:hypothetical protein
MAGNAFYLATITAMFVLGILEIANSAIVPLI